MKTKNDNTSFRLKNKMCITCEYHNYPVSFEKCFNCEDKCNYSIALKYIETSSTSDHDKKYCVWKKINFGMLMVDDYEFVTSCGKSYDCDKVKQENYCPNCGGEIKN